MRDAGNENGLRRLEVIRKLNGENREWANSELYRLMYKQDYTSWHMSVSKAILEI